ncbi:hypothetical protein B7P43_G17734, partial [Cryptotermes secundus]
SPDLLACDFFLLGYQKSKVYIDKSRTLEALSDAIAIPLAMLQRTMENLSARLQQCLENNGRHLHDVIF